jgi:hypothetical protein
MESNSYHTDTPNKPHQPGLLPHYFKKVGIVIMVLALVPAIIVKAAHIPLAPEGREMFRLLTMNAFILGLLFMVWSKDKVEDEMTISLRMKAMGWTFTWAVLFVIIKPFVDMLFRDPVSDMKSQELVLTMLLLYLLIYYVQKKGR